LLLGSLFFDRLLFGRVLLDYLLLGSLFFGRLLLGRLLLDRALPGCVLPGGFRFVRAGPVPGRAQLFHGFGIAH
jgi:hypothetical protein